MTFPESGESYSFRIDSKTGLFTFGYLQKCLNEAAADFERRGEPLSLLMMDVDNFQQYNAVLGHIHGDLLLIEAANLMKDHFFQYGIVFRYGGDEFAVLLKDCTVLRAREEAEKLRAAFDRCFSSHQVPVTISIGVAGIPESALNTRDLLCAADLSLYQSKNAGRNRVTCASPL